MTFSSEGAFRLLAGKTLPVRSPPIWITRCKLFSIKKADVCGTATRIRSQDLSIFYMDHKTQEGLMEFMGLSGG